VRFRRADGLGTRDRDVVAEEAERAVLGSRGAGVEDAATSVAGKSLAGFLERRPGVLARSWWLEVECGELGRVG